MTRPIYAAALLLLAGCTVPACYRGDVTKCRTLDGREWYAYQRIIDGRAGMIVQASDQQSDGWREMLKPDCAWTAKPTSVWVPQAVWDEAMRNGEIKIIFDCELNPASTQPANDEPYYRASDARGRIEP